VTIIIATSFFVVIVSEAKDNKEISNKRERKEEVKILPLLKIY